MSTQVVHSRRYIKGALYTIKTKIPFWLNCCPVRQIPRKDVGSKVATFKINTPTHLYSRGKIWSLRFEQFDWVEYWLDLDVKHRSHIPHLTENTSCKSQHLPTGLVQKCYFHCSDAFLFLYLHQSFYKLFASSKLLTRLFLPPDSLSTILPFLAFLASSLAAQITLQPTLVAYPCFPSL